ncbi:M56 family metallopeptidase [Agreia sp. VKM Ac-1783]|uniref:M56 family metallopeptidase n=1 Tax=Agreia sp. VKM Ac-1783 TaxID=1938889 RepID=UPI000A2AD309|nr:M56 family metallopeptidase [Agreia sp. VKM Ac-1783]SMQ57695.1 Peptidase family M48 [Agreia sp. VKM Ac-1783]
MIGLVGSLILAAIILTVAAPVILSYGAWRTRWPRLALAAWHTALLLGVLCLAASLAVSILAAVAQRPGQLSNWFEPTVLVFFGWVGLAVVGGLLALLFTYTEPIGRDDRRLQAEFSRLAAQSTSTCQQVHGFDVVVVKSSAPIALSLSGRESRIVVSSCLTRALSASQLRAVIEHERAHLVQHHRLVSRIAYLNRVCLPMLPAARQLNRTTGLLVELIADDEAARQVGAVNTANALLATAQLSDDEAMKLRARRIAARPPRGSLSSSARVRRTLATLAD